MVITLHRVMSLPALKSEDGHSQDRMAWPENEWMERKLCQGSEGLVRVLGTSGSDAKRAEFLASPYHLAQETRANWRCGADPLYRGVIGPRSPTSLCMGKEVSLLLWCIL